jgi:hypothetical protein
VETDATISAPILPCSIQPVVFVGIDTDTGQWVREAVVSFIHQFLTAFANP